MFYQVNFTPGAVHVLQRTSFEGTDFMLGFWYNQLENCYYLHVGDPSVQDGSWLVSSIKIMTNRPLLRRWRGAAAASALALGNEFIWPAGELVAVSGTSDDSIAGLGDLGARVQLYYITSDDDFWATVT